MADNEKNQFDLNGDDNGAENTGFAEENLEAEAAENAEAEDFHPSVEKIPCPEPSMILMFHQHSAHLLLM